MFIRQKLLRLRARIISLFLVCFLFCENGFSFSTALPYEFGNNTQIKYREYFNASVFVNLSVRDFTRATGNKLNFFQKIYLKVIQRQVKRDLRENPGLSINNYFDPKKGKLKFDFLWFVIASIIGPLGVLLAYTSHQSPKDRTTRKDKATSAWLGFLFWLFWFGFIFIF